MQDNPWNPQNTWAYPHGYKLTPQYYAIKHFSYFITYGYRRVNTPGNDPTARISAYLSPDNSRLVAVLINPNPTNSSVTLTLNGFAFGTSAVYQTAGTNAEVSQFASLGAAPGNLQWSLPAYSITTVVFDAPAVAEAPQVAGRLSGNSFVVSFDTQSGQTYRVERSGSLSPPAWMPVADGLPGTGSPLQITDTNAPVPGTMFYRVLLLAP